LGLQGCIATGSDDLTAKVWTYEANKWKLTQTMRGHRGPVFGVAFASTVVRGAEGSTVLLATAGWDESVRIWDAKTGTCLSILEGHNDNVYSVSWSPDSAQLV
jgi:WD40 repeat protein